MSEQPTKNTETDIRDLYSKTRELRTLINSLVPKGIIASWYGFEKDIPSGWVLCDGNNDTPDLRDKFVIGSGSTYSKGDTGGASTHTLTTDEMPSHSHIQRFNAASDGNWVTRGEGTGTTDVADTVTTTKSTGGGGAHNNLPPYFALCYIMKT